MRATCRHECIRPCTLVPPHRPCRRHTPQQVVQSVGRWTPSPRTRPCTHSRIACSLARTHARTHARTRIHRKSTHVRPQPQVGHAFVVQGKCDGAAATVDAKAGSDHTAENHGRRRGKLAGRLGPCTRTHARARVPARTHSHACGRQLVFIAMVDCRSKWARSQWTTWRPPSPARDRHLMCRRASTLNGHATTARSKEARAMWVPFVVGLAPTTEVRKG